MIEVRQREKQCSCTHYQVFSVSRFYHFLNG